jgi:hypothetical protein
MNLLMLAPLRDINGKIRYVLGAQIDVSRLVPESTTLKATTSQTTQVGFVNATATPANTKSAEYRDLSDLLDVQDRRKIQKWRSRTLLPDDDDWSTDSGLRRSEVVRDSSSDSQQEHDPVGWVNSRLSGFYSDVSRLPCLEAAHL